MDLFESREKSGKEEEAAPLAVRMRPRNLSEFVGQEHVLGEGKPLRRAIDADRISSLILYGPPGSGKTTLARIISSVTGSFFEHLSATSATVADVREVMLRAKGRRQREGRRTILFLDEIHRFNKAQQDVLMPDLEEGDLILIGATTHNPFFTIVSALLSRSQIFELKPLNPEEIVAVLRRALADKERGLGEMKLAVDEEALRHLAAVCDGDARRALNALEIGTLTTPPGKDGKIRFSLKVAEESIQKKAVRYDRDEDAHYDTASAFIKSMRGSDPDAALYWLAKMLYAGEDPRFIARRIVICAAEDVGNADPQALVLANAALQVVEFVGMPEGKIPLAQAVTYIACAPKSNAAYLGIEEAMADVEKDRTLEVPEPLKDANYPGAKKLGHGEGYRYAHKFPGHYVKQDYLGAFRQYYRPTEMGYEKKLKQWLEYLRRWKPGRAEGGDTAADRTADDTDPSTK